MGKLAAALLTVSFAAIASAASAQTTPWATYASCSVRLPGHEPTLRLQATKSVSEDGEESSRLQLRIDAEASLLNGEREISDARIEVPGHGDFTSLSARERKSGDTFRTMITTSDADGVLAALARGETAVIRLPNAQAPQNLEYRLAGSAVAIRHLEKCLN